MRSAAINASGEAEPQARLYDVNAGGMAAAEKLFNQVHATTRPHSIRPPPFAPEKVSSHMPTETLTSPQPALAEHNHTRTTTTAEKPPTPTELSPTGSARPARRGASHLLRSILFIDDGEPAADQLMLLGPSGGPIWTSHLL